jgi:hypothetical protein
LRSIRRYEDAGFDELYIQQVGGGHERFFDAYSSEILPRFRREHGDPKREPAVHPSTG